LCGIPVAQSLRSAALPVIFFLTLAALLLWLSGLLSGLAAMLSALPALLARSPLSGLTALLSLLTTLLTVFLHIVCHEHSSNAVRGPAALPADFFCYSKFSCWETTQGWEPSRTVDVTGGWPSRHIFR
jgi:hypothetical protein